MCCIQKETANQTLIPMHESVQWLMTDISNNENARSGINPGRIWLYILTLHWDLCHIIKSGAVDKLLDFYFVNFSDKTAVFIVLWDKIPNINHETISFKKNKLIIYPFILFKFNQIEFLLRNALECKETRQLSLTREKDKWVQQDWSLVCNGWYIKAGVQSISRKLGLVHAEYATTLPNHPINRYHSLG